MSGTVSSKVEQAAFAFMAAAPIAVDPGAVVVNPDGSVKGSTTIYAPKGPAGEYAAPQHHGGLQ